MEKSVLFAFDCDLTLLDGDADLIVSELGEPLPQEIHDLCDGHYWTEPMNAVFSYLHRQGVSLDRIAGRIDDIPLVKGMPKVLQTLHRKPHTQLVIVSDLNDFFISRTLNRLLDEKAASSIPLVTNGAHITEDGCLRITPYQTQWECHFCPQNLCKGDALGAFIKENGPFKQVVYVGDGTNDICPAMRLKQNDIIFARSGFALERIIKEGESRGKKVNIEAKVLYWDNGFDILNHVNLLSLPENK